MAAPPLLGCGQLCGWSLQAGRFSSRTEACRAAGVNALWLKLEGVQNSPWSDVSDMSWSMLSLHSLEERKQVGAYTLFFIFQQWLQLQNKKINVRTWGVLHGCHVCSVSALGSCTAVDMPFMLAGSGKRVGLLGCAAGEVSWAGADACLWTVQWEPRLASVCVGSLP